MTRLWTMCVVCICGIGALLCGCAPKSYVRREVKAEVAEQRAQVDVLREDVAGDTARLGGDLAGLRRDLQQALAEIRSAREELAGVRQLMVGERVEAQAEMDRVRLEVAKLNAAVAAAVERAACLDKAVRRSLREQRDAIDRALTDTEGTTAKQ